MAKWNSYSIFQNNTAYSMVFSYNAAQEKNLKTRMFLGRPCLHTKIIPGKHSYLADVFQW